LDVPFPTKYEGKEYVHFHENDSNPKVIAEHIIRFSNGYLAANPLAIEDGINSIRAPQDLPYYCHWDWNNFNLGDPESPLRG
jgi:hypothetical protein